MKRQRRLYTKEFKIEAIQLVRSSDRSASDVARHLGISPNVLNRWIREYNADKDYSFPGLGNVKEPEQELRNLRKELSDTKVERDILKKALAIFSKPSR